jgi:tripartite-type tricarboxylate transporter receptor subunit TctC
MRMQWKFAVMFLMSALPGAGGVAAQTGYPGKPIHLVVGFPPGSQADTVARLYGQKLAEALGKAVVIDSATGAAGSIAADRVAKAAPDGYTLGLMGEVQMVVNPSLYKLAYDPVKDFAPISQVTWSPNMLVVPNGVPAKSVEELTALAKAQPGVLTFASGGSGSSPHMAAELFKSSAGVDIRHIPYKGVVVALPDLLGGRVTMMFSPIGIVLPMVREGKLRALAVTSSKRSTAAADVPTIAESGFPRFEYTAWYGLVAPAGTPASVIRRLQLETAKVLALPDLQAKLADLGVEGVGNSPQEFAAIIKSEIPKWAKVIKDAGIKPD